MLESAQTGPVGLVDDSLLWMVNSVVLLVLT
jgi:hypothetical protein